MKSDGSRPIPFGPAALKARVRVSVVPADGCGSPLDFFEELKKRGLSRGGVLMESAARGSPAGVRSLVVPQGVVRLVIRGPRALYAPLSVQAGPLLDALHSRLGQASVWGEGLCARFPVGAGTPDRSDEERLRAPSVLDAARLLVGLVEDEDDVAELVPPPGLYGALSYELVDRWEDLPPRAADPLDEPDASFVLALDTVHFDHVRGEVRVVTRFLDSAKAANAESRHGELLRALKESRRRGARASSEDGSGAGEIAEKEATADVSNHTFLQGVRKFLDHIQAGDIFQGVLSRGLTMKSRASSLAVYRMLRRRNPSPYMFHLDLEEGALLGASPETCIKVEDGEVEIRPIAGTAPRGFRPDGTVDEDLDDRLAVRLLLDHKEQAEHVMLVDLARNDVARVSVTGTRRVTEPFTLEKYSHVQHLVSRVRGTLQSGLDALHAYRASANMGTLTGAPKLRAMELIREVEPFSRGFYGGAVGYLLQDGTFDSCIVIRSLRYRDGSYLTRAGAGIVADSVPEHELEETNQKASACRWAVAAAERWTS